MVKKLILLILSCLPFVAFAQYPAPTGTTPAVSMQGFYKTAGDSSFWLKTGAGLWFPVGRGSATGSFINNSNTLQTGQFRISGFGSSISGFKIGDSSSTTDRHLSVFRKVSTNTYQTRFGASVFGGLFMSSILNGDTVGAKGIRYLNSNNYPESFEDGGLTGHPLASIETCTGCTFDPVTRTFVVTGGGGSNLGNADLTQTDPTRTFTIGTNSLTFNATGTSGAVIDTVKIHMSPDGHEITARDNDGYSAGLVMNSQVAGIISLDPDGNTAQITINSSLGQAFIQSVDPDGNTKQIFMDAQSSFNQGIEVRDDSHVGLIGHEVFPISDPKQYAQYDKVDSLIDAATSGGGNTIYTGDGTVSSFRTVDISQHDVEFTNDDTQYGISGTIHLGAGGFETDHTGTGFTNQPILIADDSKVSFGINNLSLSNRSTAFLVDTLNGYVLLPGTRSQFQKGIKYSQLNFTNLVDSSLIPRKYAITLMDSVKATISAGGVTSVSGTTNRITSTGGTTPVIDISSTFEGLLAKLAANNIFAGNNTFSSSLTLNGGANFAGNAANFTNAGNVGGISAGTLTAGRSYLLPDKNGTFAMTTDLATGANPTATATTTAVNGVATTFMRSDAAPKVDSTVFRTVANSYSLSGMATKLSNYALTSSLPVAGNPSGLLTFTAANGSNATYGRTDGLHAIDSTVVASKAFVNNLASKSFAASTYVPLTRTVAGFALSSNVSLAALTATDATLTFSSSYDGSTARTVGLNLANANTWTGKHTWNNSVTASSALAIGDRFIPTLVAAANNDDLIGLDITPTYTVGAFTGLTKHGLRVDGELYIGIGSLAARGNIAIGDKTTGKLLTGTSNTLIGGSLGVSIIAGNDNTMVGNAAGVNITGTSSSSNTLMGRLALQSASTAQSTTVMGYSGGLGTGTITQGIALGVSTTFTNGSTNETVIGYNVTGKGSNTALIGNSSTTDTYLAGNMNLFTAGNKIKITEGSNGSVGQTALVAGTKAITITGLTTSSRAFVTLVNPSGTSLTTQYQAVCTSNTLTLQANVAAGTINVADVSTLNYFIIN